LTYFPTPQEEEKRLEILHGLQVLDTLPQKVFDDITALAASVCGAPMALISLVDAKRQWFKSRQGLELTETPREESFCAHTIMDAKSVLVVNDATHDTRFSDFPLVRNGSVRFYAGAPITTESGHTLGAVCVLDQRRRELSQAQAKQLMHLADLTMNLIENEAHRRREASMMLDLVRTNERIIRNVLDEGQEMCAFIDLQHRFLFVNPAFERYWVQPRQLLIGMQVQDLVGLSDYREIFRPGISQALSGHESLLTLSFAYSGVGLRHMEVRHVPAIDEQGGIYGVVQRFRDITELTAQTKLLKRNVAVLEAQRLAQQQYLHLISHEIKEPVNAIKNACSVLSENLRGSLQPLEDRCLSYIESSGQRMTLLLEDLRLFSEAESTSLQAGACSIADLVNTTLFHLKDEVARRQVRVTCELQGTLWVQGDLFELAVRYVTENLIHSSYEVKPHLRYQLRHAADQDILDLMVRVDPESIPPAVPPHKEKPASTPFQQEQIPIGLAIAEHIVNAHRGTFDRYSTPEGGRGFCIMLPKSPAK
jgi:PAS domain S-box-containing protein